MVESRSGPELSVNGQLYPALYRVNSANVQAREIKGPRSGIGVVRCPTGSPGDGQRNGVDASPADDFRRVTVVRASCSRVAPRSSECARPLCSRVEESSIPFAADVPDSLCDLLCPALYFLVLRRPSAAASTVRPVYRDQQILSSRLPANKWQPCIFVALALNQTVNAVGPRAMARTLRGCERESNCPAHSKPPWRSFENDSAAFEAEIESHVCRQGQCNWCLAAASIPTTGVTLRCELTQGASPPLTGNALAPLRRTRF